MARSHLEKGRRQSAFFHSLGRINEAAHIADSLDLNKPVAEKVVEAILNWGVERIYREKSLIRNGFSQFSFCCREVGGDADRMLERGLRLLPADAAIKLTTQQIKGEVD